MIKRIHTLLLAATMLAASSCITDEIEAGGPDTPVQDGNEVLLRLKTPCNFTAPKTRALTYAQENTIEDIYVLVFDTDGELAGIEKGDDVDDKTSGDGAMTQPEGGYSGGGTFLVTLSQAGDNKQYKLVVLANAEAILEGRGFIDATTHEFKTAHTGDSYTDVAAGLYGGFAAKYAAVTIPMWGETGQTLISPRVAIPTINMRRALARIDVGLGLHTVGEDGNSSWNGKKGSTDIDFSLTCVYVMMPNDQYALIPDPTKASSVPSPAGSRYTIITESNTFKYTEITDSHYTTRSIYVPEADLKNASNAQRMAIVVGGSYDGGPTTYYRLDFADADENLLDVLRNHLYRFSITDVSGPGYSSVKEAYEALPMNITSKADVVNDGSDFGNIIFDDNYYIAYNPGEFTFEAIPDGQQELKIKTDYPTWTATVRDTENGTVTSTSSWLKISYNNSVAGYTATGAGGDDPHDITLSAEENTDYEYGNMAYIHITAGRMSFIVTVIQKPRIFINENHVLYFDTSDPAHPLKVGRWGGILPKDGNVKHGDSTEPMKAVTAIGDMAFFKFGSVVGFLNGPDWDTNPIRFDPTERGNVTYAQLPQYDQNTMHLTDNISEPAYHYGANLRTGRGDPCQLAGMDMAAFIALPDDEAKILYLDNYNSGWRLPTPDESREFIGLDRTDTSNNPASGSEFYTTGDGNWSVDNLGIGTFPLNPSEPGITLPAGGRRRSTGLVEEQGEAGTYWLNTRYSNQLVGYQLNLRHERVRPSSMTDANYGFAIRCVRP